MKIKVFNSSKLKNEEITDRVVRVKAIIMNSNKEFLLGEAFGTVQFPGGHTEDGETLKEALKREVKEETGILLKEEYEPFFAIKHYLKDFPVIGNNRSIEIYYYKIFSDEKVHLNKTNFDDQERSGEFHLFYVPQKKIKKVLKKSIPDNPVNRIVVKEMNLALKEYKKW